MQAVRATLEQHPSRVGASATTPLPIHWLTHCFGCWHKHMNNRFTTDGDTYRTCMSCGARRHFDVGRARMTGSYYNVAPSALYPPFPGKPDGPADQTYESVRRAACSNAHTATV